MIQPQYAQDVVVGVIRNGQWNWYVTTRDWWFLDQVHLRQDSINAGSDVLETDDWWGRFGIAIVNENTAGEFLSCIDKYSVESRTLSTLVLQAEANGEFEEDEWFRLIPSFLVDFDERKFSSLFPEPFPFERYVPAGWTGQYEDFLHRVPVNEQYWMIDGRNYFENEPND